jgi:hypothetical protein
MNIIRPITDRGIGSKRQKDTNGSNLERPLSDERPSANPTSVRAERRRPAPTATAPWPVATHHTRPGSNLWS